MPVIVESRTDVAAIEADLLRVYAAVPGLDGAACLARLRPALAAGGLFYGGLFNGKWVAGALVEGPADARRLSLLAVREATRRRGVARRLLAEITRLEAAAGSRLLLADADSDAGRALLLATGFRPAHDPAAPHGFRCPLPAAAPG